MNKKIFFFTMMLIAAQVAMHANPVSPDSARAVATRFLQAAGLTGEVALSDITHQTPFNNLIIFTIDNHDGFIIMSADDAAIPVLAYSLDNNFVAEDMPDNIRLFLQGYDDEVHHLADAASELGKAGLSVPSVWSAVTYGPRITAGTPLVSTKWNQGTYYNDKCPYDASANKHALTGCVATAMAQVLKYWNHPAVGNGSHSYTHSTYGTLTANFGNTTYDWTNMPNTLNASSSSAKVAAVAELMSHAGIAVNMGYGTSSSGASTSSYGNFNNFSADNAFWRFFRYSPALHGVYRDDYPAEEWMSMLENEINNSHPILFSGADVSAGHAFVLDAINSEKQFHVNWGWSGSCDGFYIMGRLNPSSSGSGGNSTSSYNIRNYAVLGIVPDNSNGNTCVITVNQTGPTGTLSGAGTYSRGDTAVIRAKATEGNRFLQWSDGYKVNPRRLIANGENLSFTAIFEPLQGDTMSYISTNTNLSSLGSGNTTSHTYWGIRLPARTITPGHDMSAVQSYFSYAGTYDLYIISGTTSATDTLYRTSYTVGSNDAGKWHTISLGSNITLPSGRNVWIMFHSYGIAYPAAMTYYSGSDDAILWGRSLNSNTRDNSFMIRAIFVSPLQSSGDTLSYTSSCSYANRFGAGNTFNWGIMIPAPYLAGRHSIRAVDFYTTDTGTYRITIAQDGTQAPGNTIATYNLNISDTTPGYKRLAIPTGLGIDTSLNLWVILSSSSISHPATACNYTGATNSDWYSTNGTSWGHLHEIGNGTYSYSWMINCVTSAAQPLPIISLNGPTNLGSGQPADYIATATAGATISWYLNNNIINNANDNTLHIIWPAAGTYILSAKATNIGGSTADTLVINVADCSGIITDMPYVETFDGADYGCWFRVDADADGLDWILPNSTDNTIPSAISPTSSGKADNWLITPPITLPADQAANLSWLQNTTTASGIEILEILISTDGAETRNFVRQQRLTARGDTPTQQYLHLGDFAGQTIRLAFRHCTATGGTSLIIDNIIIELGAEIRYICDGDGAGSITIDGEQTTNLCGTTRNITPATTGPQQLTYTFTPVPGSHLEHIYINDIDHIDDAAYYATTPVIYSLNHFIPDTTSGTITVRALFVTDTIPTNAIDTPTSLHASLQPNPAHNSVTVSLDNTTDHMTISIVDIAGRIVVQPRNYPADQPATINIEELPAGTYFLHAQTTDGSTTQKLIIR